MGFADRARMPLADTILFSVVANVSIASLNVSLLVNSVGFYQIAKLLIIPFVCCVELFWMKRAFTPEVTACVATVFMGVAIVCVSWRRATARFAVFRTSARCRPPPRWLACLLARTRRRPRECAACHRLLPRFASL
jgi:hypothetical protein